MLSEYLVKIILNATELKDERDEIPLHAIKQKILEVRLFGYPLMS